MIRRGGFTGANANANVLTGTQFERLSETTQMRFRARIITTDGTQSAPSGDDVSIRSGAVTLSTGAINRQTASHGTVPANEPSGYPVGLSECDTVFMGPVPPGNLIFQLPKSAMWEAVSY